MSGTEALVDLSLFQTSPTDDRHFALSNGPPTEQIDREVPRNRSQREGSCPLPRSFAMKPLPPLPQRRMCRRRPARGRHDVNSRCILMRIKRIKLDGSTGNASPTIQQRRNANTTPPLTLSVPPPRPREERPERPERTERPERAERAARPTIIWMPEEQMWLVQDEDDRNPPPYDWNHTFPSSQPVHRYTRSEPSPDSNAHFNLSPLSPFSPVRSQFLRLMESSSHHGPSDRERLNPLFQEAVQMVPLTDISPWSPRPSETDQDWQSASSEYQSYHTATGSLTVDEPQIVFPQLAWDRAWEGGRRRAAEEPQMVSPQMAWGSVAWTVTRPASAMN